MNTDTIKKALTTYKPDEVLVFVNYLKLLEIEKDGGGTLKNHWVKKITDDKFVDAFKKVAIDNLYIDGKTITLQFKGKMLIFYGYQAYRKLLLLKYPESKIDLSLVHEGDNYSFRKENGRALYKHDIADPFKTGKKIIGCYCIIKNSLGENIEVLNDTEVAKMRNSSKIDYIWKVWEGEMWLKSVIKRACKRYFYDTFKNVESSDNENYDLEKVNYDAEVQKLVSDAKTVNDLTKIYKKEISVIEDKNTFISNVSKRKKEIIIAEFKSGTDIKVLKANYKLDDKYCEEIKNE